MLGSLRRPLRRLWPWPSRSISTGQLSLSDEEKGRIRKLKNKLAGAIKVGGPS